MKRGGIGIVVLIIALVVVFAWRQGKQNERAPSQEVNGKETMQEIRVTSSAFPHNGRIPEKYTCDPTSSETSRGKPDISPPLEISGVPAGAKTLALIMHDPDAPRAGGWTHWVQFNIPVNGNAEQIESYKVTSFKEGEEPQGTSGKGTGGNSSYLGPCPPSGTHRYFFTAYALDTELALKEGATKTELESAMSGHIIAKGELIGLYSRK